MPLPLPSNLDSLQVALDLDDPDGPTVARWRDAYLDRDGGSPLVDLCVEHLFQLQLCYSCGNPGSSLVLDEYPWVCARCAANA